MEDLRILPALRNQETMEKEHLFEKRGRSTTCRICGQYIKNGEEYGLLIIHGSTIHSELIKDPKYKNMTNDFIHMNEFETLMKKYDDDIEKVVLAIYSKKRPSTKNATVPDEAILDKFHEYARQNRWWVVSETKNKIRFKESYRSKSAGYVLDKRFLIIESAGKRKSFDGIILREMNARLQEYLYDLEKGFRAIDAFDEALKRTNRMLGH